MKSIRVVCLIALVALSASCKTARLVNPDPIKAAQSTERTRDAILQAMASHRWTLTGEEPGRILATLHIRRHAAEVEILYDADAIRICYLDSKQLKYRKSARSKREYIHGRYNVWVKNLARDIAIRASGP